MYSLPFPPLLTYGPSTKTSLPTRQIQILIDFTKNGTGMHQIDQIMEKTECNAKNQNFCFFNGLLSTGHDMFI